MNDIRITSIEAYRKIQQMGLLSERRWEVYCILYEHGPATAMELRKYFPPGTVDSQIRARLNELRALGIAHELGTVICSVTGMRVIQWALIEGALPRKLTPKEKLEEQIAITEEKLGNLKFKLIKMNESENIN